jgi:DNA-binding beta-propeller fold protein YncE
MLQMFVAGLLLLFCSVVGLAQSQLNQDCTVSVLNRTVRVNPDGSWVLPNVPANFGQVKARATCVRNGITTSGESDYFTIPANRSVNLPTIVMGSTTQVPAALSLTPANPSFTAVGQTIQLQVEARYPDNSTRDISAASTGTNYTTSNPAIATVSANGLVTAVASGTVVLQASNDGATGIIRATVVLSNVDSDEDGIPDDIEISLGLDSQNPVDAQEDFDRDGLTNLREFQLGTGLRVFDTDGDGIGDGLENQTGSNPLDPNSFNLAQALQSIRATPTQITLVVNTIIGVATQQLTVTGTLIDGNTINLTSRSRGTNYASSNLTVANFGAVDGLVFAGSDGSATITVTNNGFTAPAVTVNVSSFSPTALSFVSIPGFANNVDVSGNFAYVAAGSAGLRVVNVTDRRAPQIVGALDTPGNANDVRVVDNRAYVADGLAGLRIIDVTDPAAPVLLGALDTPGEANDVVVVGNRAYVADGAAGLQIIDVSDPVAPQLLGAFDTPGIARGVDVSGNIAVIADGSGGVRTVDVSNPASPIARGSLATSDARDVTVEGDIAYVAAFSNSLRIVDFSTPTTPILLATTSQSLGGILTDVAKVREFVFGADVFFVNGVPIVNVGNPASPVVRARLDFPARDDNGTGIAVDNEFIYLTADLSIQENGVTGNSRLYIGQYVALEDLAGIPPVVSISSPAAGTTVTEGATLPITVQATDDVQVASVDFLLNGNVVFTDSTAPYQFNLTVPRGVTSITLGARAVDLGSNVGTAPDVQVNVSPDQPPVVSITAPSAGTTVIEGTTLPITVQATDDLQVVSVDFLVNGSVVFTDSSAPYQFNFTIPVGLTTLTLGATALDSGGHITTAANVAVNVIPDPLTTVVGRVLKEDSTPLAGASVSVLGRTGATAADGTFSIANVPTIQGNLVVKATFTQQDGKILNGVSASFPPVPGGTTNVGDIVVRAGGTLAIVAVSSINTVAVIDLTDNSVRTNLPTGSQPLGATVTPDGSLGIISNFSSGTLTLIDLTATTPVVSGTIATPPIASPESVAVTPNGRFGIVADGGFETDVIAIDLQLRSIVSTVTGLPGNQGVAISPDGTLALVLSANTNQVSVLTINSNGTLADTGQRITLSGTSGGPRSIAFTPNGRRALVTDASTARVTILGINAGTVSNIGFIGNLGSTGFNTSGLAITPDGRKVYVSNAQSSNLAVLSIDANDNVTDTGTRISIPNGTPATFFGVPGIAITPDGTRLFISGFNTGRVSILDIATDTLLPVTITVGSGPAGIGMPGPR